MRGHQFATDPRIGHAFARSRTNAHESYNNPLGGYSTPQLRDAALRASDADSSQEEAQAYREESYGRNALEYAQKADVAAITAPRLVQTAQEGTSSGSGTSSSSGTGSQQQPLAPAIISGASGMGAALL